MTEEELREKIESVFGPCLNCDGKWVSHYDGSREICSHVENMDIVMQIIKADREAVVRETRDKTIDEAVSNIMEMKFDNTKEKE